MEFIREEINIKMKMLYEFFKIDNLKIGDKLIEISQSYYRLTEADILVGNPEKIKKIIGWEAKIKFKELIKILIKAEFESIIRNFYPIFEG